MKKIFFLILILFVSFGSFQQHAEANMVNKFKKGFYFEKYKTSEEAKAALLTLHPIGTDVDDLVKTLEKAGAKTREMQKKEIYDVWMKDGAIGAISFNYFQKYIIFGYNWGGAITYDDNRKIINLGMGGYAEAI